MAIKSVAIIGAGPSGLISLDSLIKEQKFDLIKVFERRKEAGGCWIYDPQPPEPIKSFDKLAKGEIEIDEIPQVLPTYIPKSHTQRFMDTATYSYLESNVEATSMEFSQETFPNQASKLSKSKYGENTPFRHNSILKKFVTDLYKTRGYDDHIEFNCSVELVEKVNDKWRIVLRKFGKNQDYIWEEFFDAIIVASGHYDVPYVPSIPGLQEFSDLPSTTVIHSKAFRSRDQFRNKKTIVVGASVSAMDSVQDIVDVVKKPAISSQKKTSGPHVYFGTEAFDHPHIQKRTQIVKIESETRTVYFDDDTTESDIDAIIFATGFIYKYPFLPNFNVSNHRVKGLYQLIFNIDDPTLAFVGSITAGLTFKVFEWQAVYVARVFAERSKLPPVSEQRLWEQKRIELKGDGPAFVNLYPDFEGYFEEVRKLAGNEGPGRKLPVWNPYWEHCYFRGHLRRRKWWSNNNYRNDKVKEVVNEIEEIKL